METTQLKKLKLNVTNIKSSIFSFNKEMKKIRVQKKSLDNLEENRKRVEDRRGSLTAKLKSVGTSIKSKLLSKPTEIFDKIKQFFSIILLGLLVNNLPRLIAGLQKFFGQNSWIISTVKWTLNAIVTGIGGIINLISNFAQFAGGTYDTIRGTVKTIKREIDNANAFFNDVEKDIKNIIDLWSDFFDPKRKVIRQNAQKSKAKRAPGYNPNKGSTIINNRQLIVAPLTTGRGKNRKTEYVFQRPGKPDTTTRTIIPKNDPRFNPAVQRYQAVNKAQKLATGGTISPQSSGTSVTPETRTETIRTPFASPGGSAKGRKAIQTVNYFAAFNKNTKNTERIAAEGKRNNTNFERISKKLNEVNDLKKRFDLLGDKDRSGDPGEQLPSIDNIPGARLRDGSNAEIEADLLEYFNELYGRNAAIGIVANLRRESGYRTRTPDNNRFEGIAQWKRTDRWPRFVSWAESKGLNPYDRNAQVRYVAVEIKEFGIDDDLQQSKTPEEAAQLFYEKFERGIDTGRYSGSDSENKHNRFIPDIIRRNPNIGNRTNQVVVPAQQSIPGNIPGNTPGNIRDTGIKDSSGRPIKFKGKIANAFIDMANAARREGINLGSGISSSYRTLEDQKRVYQDKYGSNWRKYMVWNSRHMSGEAFDINWNSAAGIWLKPISQGGKGNAEKFGFQYNTYSGDSTHFDWNNKYTPISRPNPSTNPRPGNAPSPTSRPNLSNLSIITNIIGMMSQLNKYQITIGSYRLTRDEDNLNLKIEDTTKGFLGLFRSTSTVNIEQNNLWLLKKLENDLKYYRNKRSLGGEFVGDNAQVIPTKRDESMISSIMTGDPNIDSSNTVIVNNTTIARVAVPFGYPVPVKSRGSSSGNNVFNYNTSQFNALV